MQHMNKSITIPHTRVAVDYDRFADIAPVNVSRNKCLRQSSNMWTERMNWYIEQ